MSKKQVRHDFYHVVICAFGKRDAEALAAFLKHCRYAGKVVHYEILGDPLEMRETTIEEFNTPPIYETD